MSFSKGFGGALGTGCGCIAFIGLLVGAVVVFIIFGVNVAATSGRLRERADAEAATTRAPQPVRTADAAPSKPVAKRPTATAPTQPATAPAESATAVLERRVSAAEEEVAKAKARLVAAKSACLDRLNTSEEYKTAKAAADSAAHVCAEFRKSQSDASSIAIASEREMDTSNKVNRITKSALDADSGIKAAAAALPKSVSAMMNLKTQLDDARRAERAAADARALAEAIATKSPAEAPTIPRLSISDATAIYQHYEKNEVRADDDMKGKWGAVRGKVAKIGKDILNTPYVAFKNDGGDFELFCVQCMFSDAGEIRKLADLSVGDTVTIAGVCNGKMGNVLFSKCQIVPKDAKKVGNEVEVEIIGR